jgi:neural Wiskott-Aldrich syndrome protein
MSADPNKKSARSFQCRDVLWDAFEQLARELECSVDYLINEAMKQYARQRGQGAQRTPYPAARGGEPSSIPSQGPPQHGSPSPPRAPPPLRATVPEPGARLPPLPSATRPPSMPLPPPRAPLPAPPGVSRPSPAIPPIPRAGPSPGIAGPRALQQTGRAVPPMEANGMPAPAAQGSTLTLVYQGERYQISKDRFVIGRGKQSSDLTLKDPNVSRQHALVEFQNGVYFIVDMGSTNGIAYNGQRIARKPIAEGDVFRICDHDLSFTYR